MPKSVFKIIISNIGGFIIFLIILAIANIIMPYIPSTIYADVVGFFNANIMLFLLMMFISMVNDIFWIFYFPFNILAPITSASLSIFVVVFFYRVWNFLNNYIKADITVPAGMYTPVALLVLLIGYILILARRGKPREAYEKWVDKRAEAEKYSKAARKRPADEIDWDDVGNEFKLFFYNIGRSINKGFEKEKQKEKKKRK